MENSLYINLLLQILQPLQPGNVVLQPCANIQNNELNYCQCSDVKNSDGTIYPVITCLNVFSSDLLKDDMAIISRSGQKVNTLNIYNSTLAYMPGQMFVNLPISMLAIIKSSIFSLQNPEGNVFDGLEKSLKALLVSENPYVKRWNFSEIEHLSGLELLLLISNNLGPIIDKNLINSFPKNLIGLAIVNDNVHIIKEKAFTDTSLKGIILSHNNLIELPVDAFPETVEIIVLESNKIESIPLFFFEKIKNFKYLSLANNTITNLDFRTFQILKQQNRESFFAINLQRNLLDCCQIDWLFNWKMNSKIIGTCNMSGKMRSIISLPPEDLSSCPEKVNLE